MLTISTTRLPGEGAISLIETIEYNPETATEFCKMVGPSAVLAKMGRPAAAHAAWPQRRGGGMSLVTGRPRDLARVRKASSALPRRVQYYFLRMSIYSFLLQHDRCCRRRHQRHGRIQERSGPEM